MKLIIGIVQDEDELGLVEDLTENGYRVTKLSTTGGFLRSGNTTLLIGVEDWEVEKVIALIEQNGKSREVTTAFVAGAMGAVHEAGYMPYPVNIHVGGATVFVLDVDEFHKF